MDKKLDPDTAATLINATLSGLYMVPVANTARDRIDKALGQLESFLGLDKSPRSRS